MVLEVEEEPLPVGWEVAMSRSKNMEYYHHPQLKKMYWVDPELPRGWSHQFDEQGKRFYFHIKNKQTTISYEKPVLRQHHIVSSPEPPFTLPQSTYADNTYLPDPLVGTKRLFDQISKDQDPTAAAAFYNNLQRNATSSRGDSLVYHMRSMNNWVKSILIHEFSKPNDCILDLACGKGGDLMKWSKRGIRSYMGVDIAQKSLEDAVDRFRTSYIYASDQLDVQFVQGDLGQVSLLQDVLHCWTKEQGWHHTIPLRASGSFHVVSMQFSFHYMFGDEIRGQRFFKTLHEILAPGGIFIATTVDPNKVLHKYYQGMNKTNETSKDLKRQRDVFIVDEKDRVACTIQFDDRIRPLLSGYSSVLSQGTFGLRYNFTLFESEADESGSGDTAVDLPEYLVPDDLLARLLKENGFELLLQQNFHPFILKHVETDRLLMEKMRVLNFEGTISDAEWEIAGLYQVLAFKKTY